MHIVKYLSPSIKLFRKAYLKDLMGIGIQFFFLQIAGVIIFASSNIIISRALGPDKVTPYNIVYRYFSVIPLIFNILIAPMWSAVTDAYTMGEIDWIEKSMRIIKKLLFYVAAIIVCMILFSNIVYDIWLGDNIQISFQLTLCMGIYTYIIVWSLSYSSFINGIGYLMIQTINTVIGAILFYPLSLLLVKEWSILGMILTLCIVNLPGAVLNTIQFNKIVKGTKNSMWRK
jgi:O-antigen/teichoic acid export membrane protein